MQLDMKLSDDSYSMAAKERMALSWRDWLASERSWISTCYP